MSDFEIWSRGLIHAERAVEVVEVSSEEMQKSLNRQGAIDQAEHDRHPLLGAIDDLHNKLHIPADLDVHHHHGPGDYDLIICSEPHDLNTFADLRFDDRDEPTEFGPAVHDHGEVATL